MNTAGDPFYVVRSDVEQALESIQAQYSRYEALMMSPGVGGDLSIARDQLKSNRARFHLTDEELKSRETFVKQTRKRLDSWQGQLSTSRPHERLMGGMNKRSNNSQVRTPDQKERDQNDRFIDHEMQQQQQIIRQQDQGLDELVGTVKRIGAMGLEMHRELNEQAEILDDIEDGVDSTSNRLTLLQRKLDLIMRQSGRGRLCLIVGLFIAFAVLTALVVLL